MGQGKEAVTVRSLILVILLVGAAFLGGAFVNGPGLQWAQARLLKSLGVGTGNEIASVDLKATGEATDFTSVVKPDPGPIAPAPTIVNDGTHPFAGVHPREDPPLGSPLEPVRPKKAHGDATTDGLAFKGDDQSARTFKIPKTSVDRSVHTASLKDAGGQPAITPAPVSSPLDSLPPLSPASAPLETAPASPSLRHAGEMAGDWATLVRKMESLGVKRFQVEGEPGGRVVFSCLIPLAGRQAVSQRFEAEDDDMVEAARATLRRISLWRAAQNGSP